MPHCVEETLHCFPNFVKQNLTKNLKYQKLVLQTKLD